MKPMKMGMKKMPKMKMKAIKYDGKNVAPTFSK